MRSFQAPLVALTVRLDTMFHIVTVVLATFCSETIIAIAMRARTRPYSTAVAPDVSSNRSCKIFDNTGRTPNSYSLMGQGSGRGVKKRLKRAKAMERKPT